MNKAYHNKIKLFRVKTIQILATGFLLLCLFSCNEIKKTEPVVKMPQSFAYILQADKFAESRKKAISLLQTCGRDLIVLDVSFSGEGSRWYNQELAAIRQGKRGRKIIAYLSIGEAENYRSYWQPEWDIKKDGKPDKVAPDFLLPENKGWQGNYKVRYWQKKWQKLIFAELEQILQQGFDGVLLDIVDGFEYFEQDKEKFIDNRKNSETGNTFRTDMINFVSLISQYGKRFNHKFMVIPQNGSQLLQNKDYRKSIDAIALEDLFTSGDSLQKKEQMLYVLKFIQDFAATRKTIYLTEYCQKPELKAFSRKKAGENGFILLQTGRDLAEIGN